MWYSPMRMLPPVQRVPLLIFYAILVSAIVNRLDNPFRVARLKI